MKNLLKELDIKIVILSRSRYDDIITTNLLPDFIEVLVPESQKELYQQRISNPVITTPDDIKGLGMLRNWCIDNFKEETIIMLDDDIIRCYSITGKRARKITKDELLQVIVNTAVMAKDLGVSVFGFTQTDIRKYNGTQPFNLCTWVGGVIGVIGKSQKFRNDKFKVDIDFCLQSLLNDRIIWCDNRYYFVQRRDNNLGGNAEFRTKQNLEESTKSLKEKWGKYVQITIKSGSQMSIKLNVHRKQDVII